MTTPPTRFFMEGPGGDLGYRNIRDKPRAVQYKQFVEELWTRFYPLADPHFREDARHHFLQRFWEMYLAVTLLEQGFDLHRHGNEGPEFYINSRGIPHAWAGGQMPYFVQAFLPFGPYTVSVDTNTLEVKEAY